MRTTYALAIVTTLALGSVALADPGKHGGPGKLERLDTNKDGKITLAEMKSGAVEKFKRLDTDKNGRVAKEELAAHHEQMRAKWAQKHADKDAAHGKRGDCHGGRGKHGHFFTKLDTNGDGAVDAAEFTGHIERRFARMDENGDKVLAGAELERRHGKHGRGFHGDKRRPSAGPGQGAAGGAANPR